MKYGEIPEDGKEFEMLFDGVWQTAHEIDPEGSERWFWGDEIGAVPMDEIEDWRPMLNFEISTNKAYRNIKNRNIYIVKNHNVLNATNSNDGQEMVLYYSSENERYYVRDKCEFLEKFEPVN